MTSDTGFAFSALPSEAQIVAALRHHYRDAFRFYRVSGVVMGVLGALLLPSDAWPFGLFAVLLGVAFVFVLPGVSVRAALRRITPMFLRPTSYRVDDRGVWMGNDRTENLYRWPGLDRVDELPGLLLARLGRSGFCAVPIGDLPPEQAAALTAFVRAHVDER